MKISTISFLFSLFFILASMPSQAATAIKGQKNLIDKQEQKVLKRMDRKQKRMENRIQRWSESWASKLNQQDNAGKRTLSLIIGSVLLVGGLVLGAAAFSASVGGFFFFLAGLLLVGGIILLLFALLKKPDEPKG